MAFTTTWRRSSVFGNQRVVLIKGTVNIVGDTLDLSHAIKSVKHYSVTSGGAHAIGVTESAGVLTFAGTTGVVSVMVLGT